MQNALLVFYGLLALTGMVLLAVVIPADTTEGMGYGLAPDVFPNLITVVFLGSALTLFAQELVHKMKGTGQGEPSPLPTSMLLHLGLCSILFFSAFPLMRLLGFVPGSMLVMLGLQLVCGARKPWVIAAVCLLVPLVAWFTLNCLGVPLP